MQGCGITGFANVLTCRVTVAATCMDGSKRMTLVDTTSSPIVTQHAGNNPFIKENDDLIQTWPHSFHRFPCRLVPV
ncbi:hypothetical protein IQ07DRAFT_249597 [Pyrenochaeta sp. DS3sAY3a]|nr:hypothetical protein IQ07DRAFT_249597 [Pyrenochaeta sp. DS3sAY3a]